jgi:hypothetical protein
MSLERRPELREQPQSGGQIACGHAASCWGLVHWPGGPIEFPSRDFIGELFATS